MTRYSNDDNDNDNDPTTTMTVDERDSETQPLIGGNNKQRKNSASSKKARWVAFSTFGLLFLFLYGLVMLPRTSLSRDWRRLHNVKYSRSDLERELFGSLDEQSIRSWSHKYTNESHLAGENYPLVEWTNNKFKEFGLESEIVQYDVYLNRPVDHSVKLLNSDGSVKFEATLLEDKLEEDPTSNLPDDKLVPTFHGYSASGNATGKFLYANLGRKQDYDLLVEKGVDFTDKIVLVRYGGIFRGLKVKFAQDLGAKAVLIYTDPAEDGEITQANGYEAYPNGPARNPSAVQRGSVQFLSYGPGDPTTPGYPSTGGDDKVDRKDPSFYIPSIPSIPISYQDALPILKELNGKGLNPGDLGDDWKGALNDFDYSVGPSDSEINVYNLQDYDIRPIYNVIAKIEGIIPDEVVVMGNHRDAWITGGAGDPNSGSAVMIELAKAFGKLKEKGWKPTRTIILASWDGEEYGLLGSTEWGEDKAKYIHGHVMAYLNVDVATSGKVLHASASPYLNDAFREVVKRIASPVEGHNTLYDYWNVTSNARISNLGSGSDYTVFLDHLGVPSVDFGFTQGRDDAVYQYHSNYDSFYWMDTFADPTWVFHQTAAKIWGLLAVTLAEQEVIAFKTAEYGESLVDYLDKLEKESESAFMVEAEGSLKQLKNDLQDYINAAKEFDEYTDELLDDYVRDYPWFKLPKKIALLVKIKIANAKLFRLERLFLHHGGLDDRTWFKHVVFAPGRYTGYAGALLPGLTEAIEDLDFEKLARWTAIISGCVKSATALLD